MTTIVHLTASRFFGGPERQMLGLAQNLPTEFRSVFVSFSETKLCHAFLDEVHRAGFEGVALSHDTPHLLASLKEVTGVLASLDADLLCCHGYKADLVGLFAARWLGIPVIAVSRGWTGECRRVRVYESLDRRVLRWMDTVVCVSEGQARKVRSAGVHDDKIAVIHNAVRPERFDKPEAADRDLLCRMFPVPPALIVGAAGRLSPEKGFDILIDAAAQVVADMGMGSNPNATPIGGDCSPVGFILFGDGPLRGSLTKHIAARGLKGKFILTGFRDDLDNYMPHLDLFVQSSFTEGLPNVILEALAASVPVVATAVGGTPEVVEDGKTGYLVTSGNSVVLARQIGRILADEGSRHQMGTHGRTHVEAHFSFSAQAREYQDLCCRLVATSRDEAGHAIQIANSPCCGQSVHRRANDVPATGLRPPADKSLTTRTDTA